MTAHAHAIVSCDVLAVDTVPLRSAYVLILVEHGTRRLHIGGVTAHPTGTWVTQQARNLAIDLGTRMTTLRFLIRDRDSKFVDAFDAVFRAADIEIIKTPPQAPRANAIRERLVGPPRRELLDRTPIAGERHLRRVLDEHTKHYNGHRPHWTPGQHPPEADQLLQPPVTDLTVHRVRRSPILGGLIHDYRQAA